MSTRTTDTILAQFRAQGSVTMLMPDEVAQLVSSLEFTRARVTLLERYLAAEKRAEVPVPIDDEGWRTG